MSNIYAVTMPKWGIEMEEGTITAWLIEEGSTVEKGTDLIDIETSKIVNTLECPYSGTLARCLAAVDDTLTVGALLGVIAEPEVSSDEVDAFISTFKPADAGFDHGDDVVVSAESASPETLEPGIAPAVETMRSGKARVSPPVRRLAKSLGVDITALTAEGVRVTKKMVEDAAAGGVAGEESNAQTQSVSDARITPMSQRRKTIAKRLVEAKTTIPHYYLTADFNLDNLLKRREGLNQGSGDKVSINDMLIEVVAKTLKTEPQMNVTLVGDDIHQHTAVNMAVAVATDEGLVAPVLAGVEAMDVHQISLGLKDLAKRTVEKSLLAEDINNGTFTISNLGMFGLTSFQAIINPPQGAILAVGGVEQRPVVIDGEVTIANMVTVNLSCDHRIIDGSVGASFLKALRHALES